MLTSPKSSSSKPPSPISKAFNPPRALKKAILEPIEEEIDQTQPLDFPDCSQKTEEISMDSDSQSVEFFDEQVMREEAQKWLSENGAAFFHVEAIRFLTQQKKREEKKDSSVKKRKVQ